MRVYMLHGQSWMQFCLMDVAKIKPVVIGYAGKEYV